MVNNKVFINCPSCGLKLSFQGVPGYENMTVTCPRCRFKGKVRQFMNGGVKQPLMETRISPSPFGVMSADLGQVRILSSDAVRKLKEGVNVLGRNSESGTADVKLTNDPYMSRRHVQIEVIRRPDGFEHRLVEINSTNIIKLNGKEINRGDVLKLNFGDVLTLGMTDIRLESSNDESTKVVM